MDIIGFPDDGGMTLWYWCRTINSCGVVVVLSPGVGVVSFKALKIEIT